MSLQRRFFKRLTKEAVKFVSWHATRCWALSLFLALFHSCICIHCIHIVILILSSLSLGDHNITPLWGEADNGKGHPSLGGSALCQMEWAIGNFTDISENYQREIIRFNKKCWFTYVYDNYSSTDINFTIFEGSCWVHCQKTGYTIVHCCLDTRWVSISHPRTHWKWAPSFITSSIDLL